MVTDSSNSFVFSFKSAFIFSCEASSSYAFVVSATIPWVNSAEIPRLATWAALAAKPVDITFANSITFKKLRSGLAMIKIIPLF